MLKPTSVIYWVLLFLSLSAGADNSESNHPPSDLNDSATIHEAALVMGSGCFWGAEKYYESLPGVIDAVAGYADGRGIEPNYKAITAPRNRFNENNYAEVVKVTYHSDIISTETLIKHFFELHDPTQKNRQGNYIGTQYRSIILTTDEVQLKVAERLRADYQKQLTQAGYGDIQTIIKPLQEFHRAEEYHQDYIAKNPNGYCPDHSTGVKFVDSPSIKKTSTQVDNSALLTGQTILVLEADSYCPYCEKFRADVSEHYQGDIPLVYRTAQQLHGLEIETPTWATPTIYFLQDGREQFAKQGYMTAKEFYQALGAFKLGDTEAYQVAFAEGTDNRFCKQYDLFKDTPPGVFVDKLSGKPLFDTDHRFNSGTGWLSFTQPVNNAVIEKPDYSLGMVRTEVIAKTSGIHLGHVFDDGPNGLPRYCINATVLDFVAR